MATFVKFPGTAGNYVSTDDVNLLDADTAHLQQSIGDWQPTGTGSVALSTAVTATFGDSVLAATADGTNLTSAQGSLGTAANPISASTAYVAAADVQSSVASREATVRITEYDAAGSSLGNITPAFTAITTGGMTRIECEWTSDASAAFVRLGIRWQKVGGGAADAGDVVYGDSVVLRTGSDGTFVPSLRIVGDLFEDIDPPDMPIVFAGDGTPLTVGEGWAGNGYHYRRYDGANSLAPLVAQFQADDVPVVAQLPSP